MRKLYPLFFLLFFSVINSSAQLVVAIDTDALHLAQTFAGSGIVVSNAHCNCPHGAAGTFTNVNSNINLHSGIVLSSGSIDSIPGPNNLSGSSTGYHTPGDSDLIIASGYSSSSSHDACVLEFDIQVPYDSLEYNYVFGSEEYLEYVNANFNDVFALFIEGPGLPFQNIALVPNTNIPVSVDNVNSTTNSQYYIDNGTGANAPYNSSDYYIQYDGFTQVLTAKISGLQPLATYHLKLAISDMGDWVYDSGVFLESSSFLNSWHQVHLKYDSGSITDTLTEGCGTADIKFSLPFPLNETTTIKYKITGEASNGTDYSMLADSVLIPAGQSDASIIFAPKQDTITEGTERLVIVLESGYYKHSYDSLIVYIADNHYVPVTVSADTTICKGASVQLSANSRGHYTWSPATALDNVLLPNPLSTPRDTITYFCYDTSGNCNSVAQFTIRVTPDTCASLTSINYLEPTALAKLFPNPSTNQLNIDLGGQQAEQVRIYNTDGKLITETNRPTNNRIDISKLSSGLYIAEVNLHGSVQRVRWVKM